MSEGIPEGWSLHQIKDIATVFAGGTPSRNKPEYFEGSNPWVKSGEVNRKRVSSTEEHISDDAIKNSSARWVDKGSVLVAMYGATAGKVAMLEIDATINQAISAVIGKNGAADNGFLLHAMEQNAASLLNTVQGSGQPNLSGTLIKESELLTPSFPEQKKIASILTSVDEVMEKTEAQISKLQDLKKGMMQELLTKGIGHTEFKDSPVGKIPKEWSTQKYASVVNVNMTRFTLNDKDYYSPVVVRRRHMGVETRETKLGEKILVKNQHKAIPHTFLISKRQIFHGSCGIVPEDIGENSILSKEYLALETTENLDIRFLDYFSHTHEFQQQIIRTTYGVDVEKFVFKDDWWMKEIIPIPPIEEQKMICNVLDSIKDRIEIKQFHLEMLYATKKALMQDLLTGKVRVKVN